VVGGWSGLSQAFYLLNRALVVDVSEAGRFVKCPACGQPQRVPGDPPKSAFPQPAVSAAKSSSAPVLAGQDSGSRWSANFRAAVTCHIPALCVGFRDGFPLVAGTLLALVGMMKLWSWLTGASGSGVVDPVMGINASVLTLGSGLAEVAVAAVCLLSNRERLGMGLVAWWATNLVVYRVGLWWMGWQRPCGCLGYLVEALGISPQAAEVLSLMILGFLLVGSYGWWFWQWKSGRSNGGVVPELGGVK
jgi:hypothetical protein